ncbi:MAG: hypothetical protein GQ574_09575 [Crocinitomix sp.]|nr:hypothetical protein [Crocinitomix sp.]
MNWKNIIGLCLLGVLISCNGGEEKSNVIPIEDFLGETGEIEQETEVIEDSVVVLPTGPMGLFVHNQLESFDTSAINEFHPIDRFTFNQRSKILFKSKTNAAYGDIMVTPRAEFFYYTFSDTTKTKNAFYNWLDGFNDGSGDEVKLNQDANSIKTPPRFALVYDTVIVAVNYRCEDQKHNWSPLEDSIVSRFGKNYNYRMEIGCGGPLKWK